uniref:MULE transposase domain-containing protein n=1 Tax=Daphnia galeata TaxID=27404 RepID=A0A8J2WKS5_9CRUS|nr:unnamed protein product [Daphnia galeata]
MSIIIVACIKQLEVEENVYRRRGKCVTVKSFNNDVRNRKKISEKWAYQKLQFVCPHYGMREHRMHKFKRLNQNVMPKNFLVQIQFVFKMDVQKYQIRDWLQKPCNFPKSLTAGGQPTRVRKLLQDIFGSHLISKDLINLKQTLAGNNGDEWKDTVDLLLDLRKDPNNVINVSYDGDAEEETTVAISECLRIFVQNNDVSVTKVTMTDKDCSKISLLETYFPDAEHILCHFHVLKAVDAWLNTLKEIDGVKKERKNYIREKFPKVMYAGTKIVEGGIIAAYFHKNWFNISDKLTTVGRQHLPTLGNNTTNRLERFHHTIKEVLGKDRRLAKVITGLVDIVRIRLSDRQLMQRIREVKFSRPQKHPLLEKFAASISPFAWEKITENMKYMRKSYDFQYHQESLTYQISSSNNKSYTLRKGLKFYNLEVPTKSYSDHWRNKCLEDDLDIPASVTSPTRVHKKEKARKPVTEREQFNTATLLFRKIAKTIITLDIKNSTQEISSPVSENSEFDNEVRTSEKKPSLKIPMNVPLQCLRKTNLILQKGFHQRKKARIAQPSSVLDDILEEENMIREEEDVALTEAANDSSIIISDVPMEGTRVAGIPTRSDASAFPVCRKSAQYAIRGEV